MNYQNNGKDFTNKRNGVIQVTRSNNISFQELVAENKREIMENKEIMDKITDRIEEKIHATINNNVSS